MYGSQGQPDSSKIESGIDSVVQLG